MKDIYEDIGRRLIWGASPRPERIYVSVGDHREMYLYWTAQWQVQSVPYNRSRDRLSVEGIPVEWVPGYTGPPTAVRPEEEKP